MANLDNKCLVCGYEFQDNDYNTITGHFSCPYCGTKKRAGGNDKDFERTSLLTQGFLSLAQSDLIKASQTFTSFIANYNDAENETIRLGNALVNCGVSTCLSYKKDRLIPIIHKDMLPTERNSNFQIVKDINPKIYTSIESLREKEAIIDNVHNNSLIIISLDHKMANKLDTLLNSNQLVLNIDITSDECELLLYKNISTSTGLVVYVNDINLLVNPYFLSVYNRFKAYKKNVIFLYEDKDDIPVAYSNDSLIDINSSKLVDNILHAVTGTGKSNENIEYSGTEVVSINDLNVTLPTGVVSIQSRAAYQQEINSIYITSAGLFTVGERAFQGSTLEKFDVQNKNCDIKFIKDAFCGCKALRTVIFNNTNIELGINTFRDCISLGSISFKDKNVKSIPTHCFDGCRVLRNVELSDTINKIEKYAFRNTQLSEIAIYSNCKIESKAFLNCRNLHTVVVKEAKEINFEFEKDSFPENVRFILRGKELKELLKYFKKNHPDVKVSLEK